MLTDLEMDLMSVQNFTSSGQVCGDVNTTLCSLKNKFVYGVLDFHRSDVYSEGKFYVSHK
jgi:hypothetical protein